MTISVGDRLPEANFKVMTGDGPDTVSTADVFGGKKVVLFAVPGAFTPTCHAKHMPTFIDNLDTLKGKGVDTVACVAVNDIFVLDAWAKSTGAKDKITLLADGSAEFTRAIGLVFDATEIGMGIRSLRYAMVVEDGVVKVLNVETQRGTLGQTDAESILAAL